MNRLIWKLDYRLFGFFPPNFRYCRLWKLVPFWCQPNIDKHVVIDKLVADVIDGTTLVVTDGHTNEKFVADAVAMATKIRTIKRKIMKKSKI